MPIDATYHGLHDWYRKSFEKFGWMLLAQNRGDLDKLKCYNRMVNHLVEALETKIKNITNKENIDDLTIMLNNSKILQVKAKNLEIEVEKKINSTTYIIESVDIKKIPIKINKEKTEKTNELIYNKVENPQKVINLELNKKGGSKKNSKKSSKKSSKKVLKKL